MQVGGSEKAYLAAKPLFLSMGKNTIYCGEAGNGSVSPHTYLKMQLSFPFCFGSVDIFI